MGRRKSPLSSELSIAVREKLMQAKTGEIVGPEMKAIAPTLSIQEKNSILPGQAEFLIEKTLTKEGVNWFLFPLQEACQRRSIRLRWSVIACLE